MTRRYKQAHPDDMMGLHESEMAELLAGEDGRVTCKHHPDIMLDEAGACLGCTNDKLRDLAWSYCAECGKADCERYECVEPEGK